MTRRLPRPLLLGVGAAFIFGVGVLVGEKGQPGRVVNAASIAVQSSTCSNASLAGNFGVAFTGQSVGLGRFTSVSTWKFDGQGGVTAKETYTSEKEIGSRSITGTYNVDPDCTFTLSYPSTLVRSHDVTGQCVIVDLARQFHCVDSETGWVALGTGTRQ